MGKRISDFATLAILMLFVASLSFWGCSDNNPASTGTQSSIVNSGDVSDVTDGGGNDFVDDSDGNNDPYPPELPNIDGGGKGSDSAFLERLDFDGEKIVNLAAAADVIDRNGGLIEDYVADGFVRLVVVPFSVSSETIFTMSVQKGKNNLDEDLFLIDFSPAGLDFSNYPILELQVEPHDGRTVSPSYELYYQAAGTWFKYAEQPGNPTGVVRFYIPHFSTYAVLKKGLDLGHDNYEL
ncbi:MAG: hypothetical protein GF310_00510 [candidate division Zixibacteria bacterium]|nr:hypothetical protein [candidate division Zixibacteria bacterium]